MAGLQGRDPAKGSAAEPFAELIRGRGEMDASEQIAFNNLQGEVAMLREMVRLLMEEIPSHPTAFEKIRAASARARASQPDGSPGRIAIDRALNTWRPMTWTGEPR